MSAHHLPEASAFSPASVGNIGVGFDILGHSVAGIGDIAHVRRIESPEVRIASIDGELSGVCQIPLAAERNTAGQALIALRAQTGIGFGFELRLQKGIPLGSGLGGSAASCVAALIAANALLPTPLDRHALYACALDGESVASGSRQGDNVAPMLLGGVVMCTPTQMIRLSAPDWLHAVVVHPAQILETRHARAVLAEPYPLPQVVQHCAHLGLFLTGLAQGERALIAAGLKDILVEPRRAPLIPGFAEVKAAALAHDALGASISGAGPSVFAWFDDAGRAHQAASAMQAAFAAAGFDSDAHIGPVNGPRAELLG